MNTTLRRPFTSSSNVDLESSLLFKIFFSAGDAQTRKRPSTKGAGGSQPKKQRHIPPMVTVQLKWEFMLYVHVMKKTMHTFTV